MNYVIARMGQACVRAFCISPTLSYVFFLQRLEEIMKRTRRTETADKVLSWLFLAIRLFCETGSHEPDLGQPTPPACASQVQGLQACVVLALTVLDMAFSPHLLLHILIPLEVKPRSLQMPRKHSTTGNFNLKFLH